MPLPATKGFRNFVGHEKQVDMLRRQLAGAKARGELFPPTRLTGPSGAGKTLLAESIADEFGTRLYLTNGNDPVASFAATMVFDSYRDHQRDLQRWVGTMAISIAPGDAEEFLCGARRGQLDWVRLLRKFVGRHAQTRPDFNWSSRRFSDLLGVVPGKRRGTGRPKVMAVLDTSGSLNRKLLELISAELARLPTDHTVTVVECDAEIQRVYPYRPLKSVCGRGGTDLRPPFDSALQTKHAPDLVVYFTDGRGAAPSKPPCVPVLWCLTPRGKAANKLGRHSEDVGPRRTVPRLPNGRPIDPVPG